MTFPELRRRMAQAETPRIEFKAAREGFSKSDALKYLCAFSNEGGGHLVLGVTDRQPRQVGGSRAFLDIDAQLHDWRQTLGRYIQVTEHARIVEPGTEPTLFGDERRVLIFEVEARPAGAYVSYKGVAYVRVGESLVPMPAERMRQIALEAVDVSARLVPESSMEHVDPEALSAFREGLVARASTDAAAQRYDALAPATLLHDLGLTSPAGTLTTAALLLVGTESALQRWLGQAEVIFEKRRLSTSIRYEVRRAVRKPLLLGLDELVSGVMPYARLDPLEVQTGTRVVQLARYPERSVREAILNAVAHRDYTSDESVFVDLSDEHFAVTSPGAFPGDVTPENVADKRFPRNRLLAESLEKCGQIERSGQGVDLMMLAAVRLAQPLPTFEEPESRRVRVTLTGRSDAGFFQFTKQIGDDVWEGLTVEDFRTLDATRRRMPTGSMSPASVQHLLDLGLAQRTEGGHLRPADRWMAAMTAAEQRQLTLDGLKDRIVDVLGQNEPAGLSMGELEARFPDQTRRQLRHLLTAMRGARVEMRGLQGGARWHAAE